MLIRVFVGMILLAACPLWAQTGADAAGTGPGGSGGGMLTPAPVSGEGYSMGFTSETRSNYLSGGLIFSTAYQSDVTTGSNGQPISDVSYSILPTISLDQTRSRLHWVFTYSPGFTFYQKTTSLNQANQNLGVNLSYRLSPHVTLSLRDTFQQSSSVLNQPNTDLQQPVSGGVSVPNYSVIAPNAEVLTNTANATLTYQFAANAMVGASGTFGNLYYPNQSQVLGLANNSSSKGGSGFYSHRLSKMHYIGVTYQYQVFSASGTGVQSETHAQSVFGFYTIYFKSNNLRFILRRSAIFQHAAARSAFITRVVAGRRCQFRLAGKTDQLCSQLLTNDQRRRGLERCCACVQCERLVAPATHAEIECRDRSELFEQ